jgi:23S rRNA (uracil1939-C5)-methyltransferase
VAGGDGLARRPAGTVVFVPRTAPGERVEVELVEVHRQWARARALSLVDASPDRRTPPCVYYERCGGCQLQHLVYPAQTSAKARIVADSFRRLGGLDLEPPEVVSAPQEFGYRNRVTFILRRTADGVVAGYHAVDNPQEIVDVDHCPLADAVINQAWGSLRSNWGANAERLPAGRELRLTLRVGDAAAVGLAIEGWRENHGDPATLLGAVEHLEAIWGVDADGEIVWYSGRRTLETSWGAQRLALAGLAFVQVNRRMAELLEGHVRAECGDVLGLRVIDAYCGFGARALTLAWQGARVVAIDTDSHAITSAREVAVESGAPARFIRAPVEQALQRELPADLVLLNPPRRGVPDIVVGALVTQPPTRLVYVSCDPATLARDLARLQPRFEILSHKAFDMFPQTAHVETVVTLSRRRPG